MIKPLNNLCVPSFCLPEPCTPKLGLDGGSGRRPLDACAQISAEALLVLTLQDMAEGAKDTLADLQAQLRSNNEAKARLRACRSELSTQVGANLQVCDNKIKTSGGYTIELTNATDWKIFDPCGRQVTKVWGDPHVVEHDGTKWDFTKDSEFQLPDGTRIAVDTSSDTGRSVTKGLHIVSGDKIVHTERGKVIGTGEDGQAWLKGAGWTGEFDGDVFRLGGDGDDWFKFRGGQALGQITGAQFADGAYQQRTDGSAYAMTAGHASVATTTAECLELLKQLKIPVPAGIDAHKPLTEEQKQMLTKTIDDALSTVGDLNEELSFKIQLAMSQFSRAMEAASSVSKKFSDIASSIIRNI